MILHDALKAQVERCVPSAYIVSGVSEAHMSSDDSLWKDAQLNSPRVGVPQAFCDYSDVGFAQ